MESKTLFVMLLDIFGDVFILMAALYLHALFANLENSYRRLKLSFATLLCILAAIFFKNLVSFVIIAS